jgi:hypothetical protein
MLLGHIVSKDGIAMDPDKVKAVLAPHNAKSLSRFMGQIRWHNRMIRHLADFATPLHAVVHKEPFTWTEKEEKSFCSFEIVVVACSSGTTSGLGEGIPRFCGCVGHSDRQRIDTNV